MNSGIYECEPGDIVGSRAWGQLPNATQFISPSGTFLTCGNRMGCNI